MVKSINLTKGSLSGFLGEADLRFTDQVSSLVGHGQGSLWDIQLDPRGRVITRVFRRTNTKNLYTDRHDISAIQQLQRRSD